MDIEKRYKETREISAELWKIYKERHSEIEKALTFKQSEQEEWWDKTVKIFNTAAEKYFDTTHEYYAHAYSIACLDDLNAIWKALQKDNKK